MGIYVPGPQVFSFTEVEFCGGFETEIRSGSRPGTESYNVPLLQDRKAISLRFGVTDQKQLHLRIPRTQYPNPHIFWSRQGLLFRSETGSVR